MSSLLGFVFGEIKLVPKAYIGHLLVFGRWLLQVGRLWSSHKSTTIAGWLSKQNRHLPLDIISRSARSLPAKKLRNDLCAWQESWRLYETNMVASHLLGLYKKVAGFSSRAALFIFLWKNVAHVTCCWTSHYHFPPTLHPLPPPSSHLYKSCKALQLTPCSAFAHTIYEGRTESHEQQFFVK